MAVNESSSIREPLAIVVVGASGDLAQKKIIPALFALYSQGLLPERFNVFGFSRSAMTSEGFRRKAAEHLTCRYVPGESCAEKMEAFLSRCHYQEGRYDSADGFLNLYQLMREVVGAQPAHLIYYLAIPASVFVDVARSLGDTGMVACGNREPMAKAVVEKPFGRDRASSDTLVRELAEVFSEDETYRIDHYLGKEIVQNLMVLRFANSIFEPLWSRAHIRSVQIDWAEPQGIDDRGQYFDSFGIIRDVMQNHLLQILALVAMEPPESLSADAVRNEKVRVLKAVPPVGLDDLVVGQYAGAMVGGRRQPGYREEAHVPPDSITPTYGAAVLKIRNARWDGVPFLLRAGKGLSGRQAEIRVRFHDVPHDLFRDAPACLQANELVIRVQPDEAIYFRIVNKVPGLKMGLAESRLNLRYQSEFEELIPDAYECLLLDVLRGEKGLFIRTDELAAAWDVFTPALHELERRRVQPEPYAFGGEGPAGARALAERAGVTRE